MKLKPLPSKKVILILEKLGFKKIRQQRTALGQNLDSGVIIIMAKQG
jgi:hypothetical protein